MSKAKGEQMRNPQSLNALFQLVVDEVTTVESYVGERSFDQFHADRTTRDAVLFKIIRIGDSCDEILTRHHGQLDSTATRVVSEASNVGGNVVRDYFRDDFTSIWEGIRVTLPELKRQSQRFL